MAFLMDNWQEILAALTMVMSGASILVRMTPLESDNKVVDAILKVLQALALNKKA
jgi:SepF-like predicted cell division protein (DUF552 family)